MPQAPDTAATTEQLTFDAVIQEMAEWRNKRPNAKAAIPDALWKKIFALGNRYKPAMIRKVLGLNSKQYQKKFLELSVDAHIEYGEPEPSSLQFCEVKTDDSTQDADHSSKSQRPSHQPKSVEDIDRFDNDPPRCKTNISQMPATNTMVVEFHRKNATEIMTIHATTNHLHDLVKAFYKGDI